MTDSEFFSQLNILSLDLATTYSLLGPKKEPSNTVKNQQKTRVIK